MVFPWAAALGDRAEQGTVRDAAPPEPGPDERQAVRRDRDGLALALPVGLASAHQQGRVAIHFLQQIAARGAPGPLSPGPTSLATTAPWGRAERARRFALMRELPTAPALGTS